MARTISEVLARYWTVRDQGAVVGQDGFPAARREEGLDLRSDPVHVAEDRPVGIPPGRADGQNGLLENRRPHDGVAQADFLGVPVLFAVGEALEIGPPELDHVGAGKGKSPLELEDGAAEGFQVFALTEEAGEPDPGAGMQVS